MEGRKDRGKQRRKKEGRKEKAAHFISKLTGTFTPQLSPYDAVAFSEKKDQMAP